jgi:hypothetical protein
MEALRRIIGCAFRASKFSESGGCLVYGILLIGQATPVATIYDEDCKRESCTESVATKYKQIRWVDRTVTKDKLGDASDVHGQGAEEVVVGADADQALRRDSSLKSAQNEDSRSVRDQEPNEPK